MRAICCVLLGIACAYILSNCVVSWFQPLLAKIFNVLTWLFLILSVIFMCLGL